jgi:hypothetical protein
VVVKVTTELPIGPLLPTILIYRTTKAVFLYAAAATLNAAAASAQVAADVIQSVVRFAIGSMTLWQQGMASAVYR